MAEQTNSPNKTGKLFSVWDIKGTIRFLRYTCVGGGTFLFDLALLYLFTDGFNWSPVFSAGLAFLIAVSLNYIISRRLVFKGTTREFKQGYLGFLLIAGTGLIIVTGGMFLMVDILHWQYIISRILISLITGLWNYILNLYVNFRVAGKHLP
ncbi:GtrA family protein [Maridesulfovibrio salexigens]|uniref:GtrA family protein n=1 Tax=Maridesulfovibrio salexigens (strain ATCC 14822 / DSM 2638 / NCIMB 8403 / VKM B-1763) TaxID=526222 RepID=C6BS73_MARSD|nr:GtrA family protein [Maridesulfovibrio salexigens]ACS79549.1 GtrA family protein [Maridesulfovibrio salexigens DSM 2638]